MVAEVEIVQHVDDVMRVIGVLLAQLVQDANLDQRLVMEPLLVPDYLDGHVLVGFVVQGPNDLAEAALANHLEDLVAVRDVVMDHLVVAPVVIVVAAVQHRSRFRVDLARVQAEVPDLVVLFDLLLLEVSQAVAVQLEGLCERRRAKVETYLKLTGHRSSHEFTSGYRFPRCTEWGWLFFGHVSASHQ